MPRRVDSDCSICLEDFRLPRLLPCGHTFCTRCLQQLVGESQSRLIIYSKRFHCPLCRTALVVPAGGIERYPRDFAVVNRRLIEHRARQGDANAEHAERNNETSPTTRPRSFLKELEVRTPSSIKCGIVVLIVALIAILFFYTGLPEMFRGLQGESQSEPPSDSVCHRFARLISGLEKEEKRSWYSPLTHLFQKMLGSEEDEKTRTWREMMLMLHMHYDSLCRETEGNGV